MDLAEAFKAISCEDVNVLRMNGTASCGWISGKLLLNLYVNLQVKRLLNKSQHCVSMSSSQLPWHVLMSLCQNTSLWSWHQFKGRKTKTGLWFCFFSASTVSISSELNLSAVSLSFQSFVVRLTETSCKSMWLSTHPWPPRFAQPPGLSVAGGGGDGYNGHHQL